MADSVFRIKRAYTDWAPEDGFRVLVDRLWPRGIRKDAAHFDEWLKDVAPSTELRKWWGHDPARMAEFSERYRSELDQNPAVDTLRTIGQQHPVVTLVYGARDSQVNHAIVLQEYLG